MDPSSDPRPEAYHTRPPPSPQQQTRYVQAVETSAEGDRWSTGQGTRFIVNEDISRPRISETPRPRSPSPTGVGRRRSSKTHSRRIRFEDEDYGSDSDLSVPVEKLIPRSWHTSNRGFGYTQNDSSTVYSFAPTRASRAPSSSRTANTDEEETEKSENGLTSQESGVSRIRATYVFESRYTGESRLGDPHTVKLFVQRTTAVKQKHLFRWM